MCFINIFICKIAKTKCETMTQFILTISAGLLSLFGSLPVTGTVSHITEFDAFCEADILYKPYMKYYTGPNGADGYGRYGASMTGTPNKTLGPGLYSDFLNQKNTYVCINGPAWMYYALIRSTDRSLVYQKPELHIFKHNCMLTNYADGPGPTASSPTRDEVMLYAILLMGDPVDYRRPFLQMFPAPAVELVWDTTKTKLVPTETYINATSLLMIGDATECILLKGRKKMPFRIKSGILKTPDHRPDPSDVNADYIGTFCKFSYPTLVEAAADNNLEENPDADLNKAQLEFAALALKDNGDLIKQGCYVPDNYDSQTVKLVGDRHTLIDGFDTNTTDPNNVLQLPDKYLENKGWDTKKLAEELHVDTDLKYSDLMKFLTDKDPPCNTPQPSVLKKCPPFPPGDCTPAVEVKECSPVGPPPCEPCDPANAAVVQDFIKLHLQNIMFFKSLPPDPTITSEIKTANAAIMKARIKICLNNLWTLVAELGAKAGTGVYKKTLDAWDITKAPMKALDEYVTLVGAETPDAKAIFEKKQEAAAAVAKAETLRSYLKLLMETTKIAYDEFIAKVNLLAAGGDPNCGNKMPLPFKSDVITIRRDAKVDDYLQPHKLVNQDPTKYPSDTKKTCGELPKPKATCASGKPDAERAPQLLRARMNNFNEKNLTNPSVTILKTWNTDDEWREGTMDLISSIFSMACDPMIKNHFATNINLIIKGYLIDYVKGTLRNADVTYTPPTCTPAPPQGGTCGTITEECDPLNDEQKAISPTIHPCVIAPLPTKRPFWDILTHALVDCKKFERKLYFQRNYTEDKNREYYTFLNPRGNPPYSSTMVENNIEQADAEYSFNYAIDSFWRIFATVLGICMPYVEKYEAHITAKFYAYFTEDFFYPLAKEWRNNRDNAVFNRILGEYYGKRTDYWTPLCMESAFIQTGTLDWRPPRKLLVNGMTEMNFFIQGPIARTGNGKSSIYY